MPLYDYECKAGHVVELVASYGEDVMPCPACGADATRHIVSRPYITKYEESVIENVRLSTNVKEMREQAERKGWEHTRFSR